MRTLCLLCLFLLACPSLPPPDGCTPGTWRCTDRPQRCSSTQRWTSVGDFTCAEAGGTCQMTESYGATVAACLPVPAPTAPESPPTTQSEPSQPKRLFHALRTAWEVLQ